VEEQTYGPPVDRLLVLGGTLETMDRQPWLDYPARFGLTADHIPDLLRILADPVLLDLDYKLAEDDPRIWTVIHAWRALGQLRAEAAIEPLLGLLITLEDWDWVIEEAPDVLGMIGPAAVAPVSAALARTAATGFPAISYARALRAIVDHHPEARDAVVKVLVTQLDLYPRNNVGLNGFLILHLADLKVVEVAPLIEQVFRARRVDEKITGDWEDIQVALGLLAARVTPRKTPGPEPGDPGPSPRQSHPLSRTSEQRRRSKRKLARASRRRNRRRTNR
jgi:hypothetical protein